MKTIIIPTDFSPTALNAMNYGIDMAREIKAEVLLFNVYNVPMSMTDVPVMLLSVEELQKNAETQMAGLKAKAEHVASGEVKIDSIVKLGDTVDELELLCDSVQPFAVIMGTRDSSGIERTIFGSNTYAAIRRLKWPVIAIPPGKEYGHGVKRVGFACDFKNVVETTPAGAIKDVVKQFDAEFHVLNVNHNNHTQKDSREFVLLETMLEEAKPIYDFIQHEDVEDGINEFAEKNNLDLVIAIPKKHNLLDKLFSKRSTRQLVFHSHIPVMCIHE
jgi:nucleotide-binding universal stress UspA family protein